MTEENAKKQKLEKTDEVMGKRFVHYLQRSFNHFI